MTNYKFTVTLATDHERKTSDTNDFKIANDVFDEYAMQARDCGLSEYEVVFIDNRTGEVYRHVNYCSREVTEEELAMLDEAENSNSVENLFSDSLAADIEQCLEEMSADEFAELAEILLDMFDE